MYVLICVYDVKYEGNQGEPVIAMLSEQNSGSWTVFQGLGLESCSINPLRVHLRKVPPALAPILDTFLEKL